MIFLNDSKVEKQGYQEVLDYQMSKKFGLNWKLYDNKRMCEFIRMMVLENERQNKLSNKQYGRSKVTSNNRGQR